MDEEPNFEENGGDGESEDEAADIGSAEKRWKPDIVSDIHVFICTHISILPQHRLLTGSWVPDSSQTMLWLEGIRTMLAIQQDERQLIKLKLKLSKLRLLEAEAVDRYGEYAASLTRLVDDETVEEMVDRQLATFAVFRGGGTG
jgi:hypothetical protein